MRPALLAKRLFEDWCTGGPKWESAWNGWSLAALKDAAAQEASKRVLNGLDDRQKPQPRSAVAAPHVGRALCHAACAVNRLLATYASADQKCHPHSSGQPMNT